MLFHCVRRSHVFAQRPAQALHLEIYVVSLRAAKSRICAFDGTGTALGDICCFTACGEVTYLRKGQHRHCTWRYTLFHCVRRSHVFAPLTALALRLEIYVVSLRAAKSRICAKASTGTALGDIRCFTACGEVTYLRL